MGEGWGRGDTPAASRRSPTLSCSGLSRASMAGARTGTVERWTLGTSPRATAGGWPRWRMMSTIAFRRASQPVQPSCSGLTRASMAGASTGAVERWTLGTSPRATAGGWPRWRMMSTIAFRRASQPVQPSCSGLSRASMVGARTGAVERWALGTSPRVTAGGWPRWRMMSNIVFRSTPQPVQPSCSGLSRASMAGARTGTVERWTLGTSPRATAGGWPRWRVMSTIAFRRASQPAQPSCSGLSRASMAGVRTGAVERWTLGTSPGAKRSVA